MKLNQLVERLQLPSQGRMPGFDGATTWLNSDPLTPADLRGKVVAVQFWTFTCINWLRTLPYARAWSEAYRERGFVLIGVHTPEFGVEHDIENIRGAAERLRVAYPVAVDNDYAVWNAFANQYWPALYVADAEGKIRHHHFGEGEYERSEHVIRRLLGDAGSEVPGAPVAVTPAGIEVEANWRDVKSPESYLGTARSRGFTSPGGEIFGTSNIYTAPAELRLNEWSLAGAWTIGREEVVNDEPGARLAFRFHARDLNLVLAPTTRAPVRFRVRLDGETPRSEHGVDVDADGKGVLTAPGLAQLIRQSGAISDRRFEIEFLDPGAAALCFTFG